MQYESNPANGFRGIVRKRNTTARQHARTAARSDMVMEISLAPTSWVGDKKANRTLFEKNTQLDQN